MASTAEQSRTDCSAVLPPHLPVNHTCDGCSARAAYEARLPSGKSLLLCGHHTNRHMDALVSQGATVYSLENK